MDLLVIGGGTMGSAMLRAALAAGVVTADGVTVVEPVPERREELAATYGVKATASAGSLAGAGAVLLAVKPQDFGDLGLRAEGNGLVISIMAGVPIARIREQTDAGRIVRVMPNLPAAAGAGMSAWTATAEVTGEQREFARRLLAAAGSEVEVTDEGMLDMATAVSGSGPGYVYLFIEALIDAAVNLGFEREQATEMALQTFEGAVAYARESGKTPAELRAMVTSRGGTTAAGLEVFEGAALRATINEAVKAAHLRARELGGLA